MIPVKFKEANRILGKPESIDVECENLYVLITGMLNKGLAFADGTQCVSCWKLSFIERLKILLFGTIWLSVMGNNTQPPVWMSCARNVFERAEVTFDEG